MNDIKINSNTRKEIKKLSISDLRALVIDLTERRNSFVSNNSIVASKFETMLVFCQKEVNKRLEDIFNFKF